MLVLRSPRPGFTVGRDGTSVSGIRRSPVSDLPVKVEVDVGFGQSPVSGPIYGGINEGPR